MTSLLDIASAYGQSRSKRSSLSTSNVTFEMMRMSQVLLSDPCGLETEGMSDEFMFDDWDSQRRCFTKLLDKSMSEIWTELVDRKLAELGIGSDGKLQKWYVSSGERELDVQTSFRHTRAYTVHTLPQFYHAFVVRAMVPVCQSVVFQWKEFHGFELDRDKRKQLEEWFYQMAPQTVK